MSWNQEWLTFKGPVRVVTSRQEVKNGVIVNAFCRGDMPVAVVRCENGNLITSHPKHVWPVGGFWHNA